MHGALRDAFAFTRGQLEIELNAAQENPLLVLEEDRIVSVANFDVLPLAAALDFLRIALAPALTSACERLLKLLQGPLTGLPDALAPRQGLVENSLGELGVTAQALAAEARLLAQPVSFEVVTTTHAEGIEDRMTMAPLAARRLAEMVALGESLVAIELVIAAQAVDLRAPPALGAGTRRRVRARARARAVHGRGRHARRRISTPCATSCALERWRRDRTERARPARAPRLRRNLGASRECCGEHSGRGDRRLLRRPSRARQDWAGRYGCERPTPTTGR